MKRAVPTPSLRLWAALIAALCVVGSVSLFAQAPQGAGEEALITDTHRFEEVAPGVYFATGTGSVFVQSNALVIVNDADTIVVDSHVTAAAARALLDSVKKLTDKPVRFLINTHYHFDHAHGNQAFPKDVSIVGHEYTRERLSGNVLRQATYLSFTSLLPDLIADMRETLEAESDAAKKAALEGEIRVQEAHLAALAEVRPTPPDVTLERKMTLHRGERAIELHFLGRGHTGGDVVVFLPKERVVFTGDLLLPFPSYMGDGYVDEWVKTLDKLKELEFALVLPGHGPPFEDRRLIDVFQNVLQSLWSQVVELRRQGLSPEEAVARVDLSEPLAPYPVVPLQNLDPRMARLVDLRQVARIYEVLKERETR